MLDALKLGITAALLVVVGFVLLIVFFGHSNAAQAVTSPTGGCSTADFSLSKLKAGTEYDNAKLTGIVTNKCSSASGVQLKWTAFNADGSVAFSENFWPASTTNIPGNSQYPFEMMNSAPRGKWTYRVEPISVTVW